MPKSDRSGRAKSGELPSTLQRSDAKAQRTYTKTHDSAAQTYGDERRAHQTAYAAVKHSYVKVADHWEPKQQKGPSGRQAGGGRDTSEPTAGGVDANASKQYLREIARRFEIRGRSSMSKDELVQAIRSANDRASAEARRSG